MVVCSTS
ncbi:unnamed protein product [Acanthoscelides obtectus]|nr:unnamed protein product [Acanthoscelides obtectus]CAK1659611.1 hypothetical protein AOBTE_LOCUS21574 [Acanthoscelides obtectus]